MMQDRIIYDGHLRSFAIAMLCAVAVAIAIMLLQGPVLDGLIGSTILLRAYAAFAAGALVLALWSLWQAGSAMGSSAGKAGLPELSEDLPLPLPLVTEPLQASADAKPNPEDMDSALAAALGSLHRIHIGGR